MTCLSSLPNCLSPWNIALPQSCCSFFLSGETTPHFNSSQLLLLPGKFPLILQVSAEMPILIGNLFLLLRLIPEPHPPTLCRSLTLPPRNSYLAGIGIVYIFSSPLLLAPERLRPCLFTFITLDLAPNQYACIEEIGQ